MSSSASDVFISDLKDPVYPDFIQQVLDDAAKQPRILLSPESAMDSAREQTGLNDFGDMEFVGRLSLIMQQMDADAGLSPMGRSLSFGFLVRNLVQRLRFVDLMNKNPSIDDIPFERPIVIAGLPRSGTTHMLNLISVDKRLRSLPYWESLEPFPDPAEDLQLGGEDPRIQRCRDQLAMQDQIMPYFKNMHDMYPEHVHEEIELQFLDFSTMLLENYALMPKWRDYYLAHDQTPHYQYMKRALKALQWQRGPDRWILKSPQHMEQLKPLKSTFPDATFVIPHRDPVSVATSLITMVTYSARMSRSPVDAHAIGDYWVDRVERMLQACVRDIDSLPAEQVIHVNFDQFMSEDIQTIERIYALAGLPMTSEVKDAMQAYITANPRGKYGRVRYDLKKDFGLNKEALYERFKFYTDRFSVKLEDT